MTKQAQEIDALPSMTDFEEGSSLLIEEEEEVKTPENEEEEEEEPSEPSVKKPVDSEEETEEEEEEEPKPKVKKKEPEVKAKEEEEQDEEVPDSAQFYKEVSNLHGVELEVDYGDVDPLTPEGVAIREQALIEAAISSQMEYLAKSYPKEFKLLEYAANGGNFDDIFKPGYIDYSKITLDKEDTDQHRKILKDYYADKGISENKIERLIEADEDSEGGTFKAAEEVLKERVKVQKEREDARIKEQEKIAEAQKKRDAGFKSSVSEVITSGKVGNLQIPKADQESFYAFTLQQIQRTGDGYSLVVPVTQENMDSVMQQAYFAYKKGDLSKLVESKARQVSTQRLKMKVKETRKKASSEESPRNEQKSLNTMADFTVEE